MTGLKHIKQKAVVSGNIVEIYTYEKGYCKGYEQLGNSSAGRKKGERSEDYQENREKVLKRASRDLRRLINANVWCYGDCTPKFATFTFADNVIDLEQANNEWQKFIKRLNYRVFGSKRSVAKYSVVVEFQRRGAVHYHAVFYNLPFINSNELASVWGNGFVKINKIDNVDNIGAYVTKYMTKESKDPRLSGKKSYFSSRGLLKPVEITDEKEVSRVWAELPPSSEKYNTEFENDYLGLITYHQYNLNKAKIK